MEEISLKEAKEKDLKLIGKINAFNLSQTVLMMKIQNDLQPIKYYTMEFIIDEEENGSIIIGIWQNNSRTVIEKSKNL